MKSLWLALSLALVAQSASALSCMRPDPARAFLDAQASPDAFVVLSGQFDFPDGPTKLDPFAPTPPFPAQFTGEGLGENGFEPVGTLPVLLSFTCVASWCGSIKSGDRVATLAKVTDQGYQVDIDPCFSRAFTSPTQEVLSAFEACMRGDACTPALPR